MNLQKLNAFYKVVECRSISKAAAEMGYTQSAVSKMIGELEREWDVTLVRRNHDGVEVTSEGNLILEEARRLLHDYDNLNSSIAALHGINRGTIRLGAPVSISANLLPEVLQAFHLEYPNIKVELYEGEDKEISELLRRGVVDICVLPKPFSEKYLTYPIYEDSLIAILPKNHSMTTHEVFPIKAFETEEMIRIREVSDYDMNRFLDENQVNANIVYEVNNDHTMLSMVESGLGVSMEYELVLHPLRYQVEVKPMDFTKKRILSLCIKDESYRTPLIRLFIDCVKQAVVEWK